jgi:hypothetical protein
VMGCANVGLAGLDVGLEVGVVQKLAGLTGKLAMTGVQVSRQQWSQAMELAKQGSAGMAKAKALLGSIKGLPKAAMNEILDAISPVEIASDVGNIRVPRRDLEPNQPMQMKGNAGGTATSKKPPKAFEAYTNAGSVKPFIGTKVDPNNLPPGYLYGKMPLENGKFREVIYLPKSDGDLVPLKLDAKGFIKKAPEGEYRIVSKTAYDKNVVTVPGKPGKLLGGKSEIHHLFADNLLRGTPFGQRALRLGAVNPDAGPNLIELASSMKNLAEARKAHPNVQFSDFIHNTQHPLFDGLLQEVVDQQITLVREAKGLSGKNKDFIPQMTKEEIKAVWERSLMNIRRGLMGEDKELYREIEKRTRPGKNSLAQGENPDNSEVA